MGCQQKAAYVFGQKIREAIAFDQKGMRLSGEIAIDGAYFGGHRESFNTICGRSGKRISRKRFANRQVLVGARDKVGRVLFFKGKKESDALLWAQAKVREGSTILADQAHAWSSLKRLYRLLRVNHSYQFQTVDGIHTNTIETMWALMRRKQLGVHHRVSGRHLGLYAAEMAWHVNIGDILLLDKAIQLLRICFAAPPSSFRGYYQRRKGDRQDAQVVTLSAASHT